MRNPPAAPQSIIVSSTTSKNTRGRTTKGASTAASSSQSTSSNVVISIAEGRGTISEIGLAIINLNSSECSFMQHADTQTFTKTIQTIVVHQPVQILLPENTLNGRLYSLLVDLFQDTTELIRLKRSAFNERSGTEYVGKYSKEYTPLEGKYFALCALSALFHYLEEQRITFYDNSVQVEFKSLDGLLVMDFATIVNLELVSSISANAGFGLISGNNLSLYKVLDFSYTKMGSRLLRMNIIQPLTDLATIEQRLDAVESILTSGPNNIHSIRKSIKALPDLDRLICSIVRIPELVKGKAVEFYLGILLSIQVLLRFLPAVASAVESLNLSQSSVLESIHKALGDGEFDLIRNYLDNMIDRETTLKIVNSQTHRLFALKPGTENLLKVARQTYSEVTSDIDDLLKLYREKYEMNIKCFLDPKNHVYVFQVPAKEVNEQLLPLEFVNRKSSKKSISFTTVHLLKLNERLNESVAEILMLSEQLCSDALRFVRQKVRLFYKCAEAIGLLDMILSIAIYAMSSSNVQGQILSNQSSSCRPEFTDTLALRNARHPIKEKTLSPQKFIPNDTFMFSGCNFQIITGPNMSGKSTFLKQICLLVIMSQIGCFVPAEYASVRVTSNILTRIGNEDCPSIDCSGFAREMNQMQYILENINDYSLIIIDELGRGTALYDSLAIACSISEEIIKKSLAFTFLATHFPELSSFLDSYPNVVNLHLEVSDSAECLYKVETGACRESNYGLRLAQSVGYPEEVIKYANDMSTKHEQLMKQKKHVDDVDEEYCRDKKLYDQLLHIANSSCLRDLELKKLLIEIKREYLRS